MTPLRLRANDGTVIVTTRSIASHSDTIRNTLSDIDDDVLEELDVMASGRGLQAAIDFYTLVEAELTVTASHVVTVDRDSIDKDGTIHRRVPDNITYLSKSAPTIAGLSPISLCTYLSTVPVDDVDALNDILNTSIYLDNDVHSDVLAKMCADLMHGMTTEQIRDRFRITNDFSAEQWEEACHETAWCSEGDEERSE